jgi:hypothetical protein
METTSEDAALHKSNNHECGLCAMSRNAKAPPCVQRSAFPAWSRAEALPVGTRAIWQPAGGAGAPEQTWWLTFQVALEATALAGAEARTSVRPSLQHKSIRRVQVKRMTPK